MKKKSEIKIWLDFTSLVDASNFQIDMQYQDFLYACLNEFDVALIAKKADIAHAEHYLKEHGISNVRIMESGEKGSDTILYISKQYETPCILDGKYCCALDFESSLFALQGKSLVEVAKQKLLYTVFSHKYEFIIDKDTQKECEFIRNILNDSQIDTGRILDCFCGCGRHEPFLNSYGFQIDGVDISEEQIKNAIKNSSPQNHYFVKDIRDFEIEEKFYDASICMWTSFNYLSDETELKDFIAKVAKGLKRKGIFILDTKNFCAQDAYKIYTKQMEDDDVRIQQLIIKILNHKIQNSRYLYFIYNKMSGDREFWVDKEMVKIYSFHELTEYAAPYFQIKAVYGDFEQVPYEEKKSDRMIFVLEKREI